MMFQVSRAAMQMLRKFPERVGRLVMALTHVVGNLRANTEGTEGNDGKELLTKNQHSYKRYCVSSSSSTSRLPNCRIPFCHSAEPLSCKPCLHQSVRSEFEHAQHQQSAIIRARVQAQMAGQHTAWQLVIMFSSFICMC